jgi:hypothetical protein
MLAQSTPNLSGPKVDFLIERRRCVIMMARGETPGIESQIHLSPERAAELYLLPKSTLLQTVLDTDTFTFKLQSEKTSRRLVLHYSS